MIELHVDQLVLHGFDPRHRYRIADSFQCELERLLVEEGLPPGWEQGAQDIPLRQIEIAADTRPEDAGIQIARAVYARFTHTRRR